jgi:hypothetical protein
MAVSASTVLRSAPEPACAGALLPDHVAVSRLTALDNVALAVQAMSARSSSGVSAIVPAPLGAVLRRSTQVCTKDTRNELEAQSGRCRKPTIRSSGFRCSYCLFAVEAVAHVAPAQLPHWQPVTNAFAKHRAPNIWPWRFPSAICT